MRKLIKTSRYIKYLLFSSLLLIMTSLYADNLYVGVQGGWQNLTVDGNLSVIGVPKAMTPFHSTSNSGVVDFYLGVQKKVSPRILIAAESDVMLPFARTTVEQGGTVANQKLSYNVGGSLKAGVFYIKNGDVYARAGLGVGSFKGGVSQPGPSVGGFPTVNGDNIFYYRLGLGVNQQFSAHWAAQLEYDYYHYSPFNLSQKVGTGGVIVVTHLQPTMNVVMGGLSYIF